MIAEGCSRRSSSTSRRRPPYNPRPFVNCRRNKLEFKRGFAFVLVTACLLVSGSSQAAPACTVEGGPRADHLDGTNARDVICGRGGADVIHGLGGDDRILGGSGSDRLLGGPADDTLLGGPGNDQLRGGLGTDRLAGGPGRNRCPAGAKFDRVSRCRVAVRRAPRSSALCWYQPPCSTAYVEPPDLAPPRLYSGGVGPEVADASAGPLELMVYATAWDEYDHDLNESDVASATARVLGPAGFLRDVVLSEDVEEPGHFRATTVVVAPQPGFYKLESVALADVRGNSGVLTKPEFGDVFGPGVEVYAGPDEAGPELLDFAISPLLVDTSNAPATVTMSAHVSDPLAGARQVGPSLDIPSQEPSKIFGPGRYGFGMALTEGDVHDGVWITQFHLPRHAAPGTYEIGRFDLYDRIGEYRQLERDDLEAAGFPVTFEVAAPGDSEPPDIAHLGVGRPIVRAADGEDEVVFFLNASDDLSGIAPDEYFSFIRVVFLSPEGPPGWESAETTLRFSGTELDGVWKVTGKLAADAPFGTYQVTNVGVADRAGNVAGLEGKELDETGWDLSFENRP